MTQSHLLSRFWQWFTWAAMYESAVAGVCEYDEEFLMSIATGEPSEDLFLRIMAVSQCTKRREDHLASGPLQTDSVRVRA